MTTLKSTASGVCAAIYRTKGLLRAMPYAAGLLLLVSACNKENDQNPLLSYEITLDAFVADLQANPLDSAGLSDRVRDYLAAQSGSFFGATVALLDNTGKAYYSPYWFRLNDTLAMKNLADSTYQIDEQEWLRLPIESGYAIWTEPYFDAGGGEVWMRTRAVPVLKNNKIVAVATTDVKVQ
tara:strand:- start:1436 stop:1978 length:543 start_codon:yes stop_codon:yes gene_type:complete